MLKNILLLVVVFCCFSLQAQNLVVNPGFELRYEIDSANVRQSDYFSTNGVTGWCTPFSKFLTTDFYAPGVSRGPQVEKRFPAANKAHSGNSFAGLYLDAKWKEYMRGTLTEPLEAGKNYRITFWVLLSEQSDIALYNLNLLFYKEYMCFEGSLGLSGYINQSIIHGMEKAKTDGVWTQIALDYQAVGGEKYFILGYGGKEWRTKTVKKQRTGSELPFAYYFFDDFSMVRHDGERLPVPAPLPILPVTRNLYFDVDLSVLKPQSKLVLDTLAQVLKARPKLNVTLDGHTDTTGNTEKNIKLSEERAKAAAAYLIAKGIDPKRITTRSFADEKPVSDDNEWNRRVEFFFTQ
ncbi:MAG: OmpA family protein [Bacteroidia bacterium]